MARLGSQAKAGFYPTPEKVCGQLKQLLDIEEDARLLDPCCGKGKTLANLAAGYRRRNLSASNSIINGPPRHEADCPTYYGAIRWSRPASHRPRSGCSF